MNKAELNSEEQLLLLQYSNDVLKNHLQNQSPPQISEKILCNSKLTAISSCFVTYYLQNRLRGCIGSLQPSRPLYEEVARQTIQAATQDHRFSPIVFEELESISTELTILLPVYEIPTIEDFILGKHGIILTKHGRQAVFLPQVAVEQGWSKEETMQHLCHKAGLAKNDWQQDVLLEVFEAQKIK